MQKNLIVATSLFAAVVAGCSPHLNWREFTSKDASYQVLFPGKPSTASREIDLDGLKATMTMNAAEIDGIVFAVGHTEAPDAAAAGKALAAMQLALVRNISGTITHQAISSATSSAGTRVSRDIDVAGQRNDGPVRMVAHFEARGRNLYQVVLVGPAGALQPELTEQFLGSFKALK